MRIGFVTTSFPRWEGDWAGEFVGQHANWLASRGHHIEVVAAGDDEAGELPPRRGVSVLRVPGPEGLFYRGGAPEALERSRPMRMRALLYSLSLGRVVTERSRDWDAVIAHWLVPCGLATMASRVPTLAIAHSGDVEWLLRYRLEEVATRFWMRAGIRIGFVSSALRNRFAANLRRDRARRFIEEALVCPMGVSVEHWSRVAREVAAVRAQGPEEPRRVLFLGRLQSIKGAAIAVAASARWRDGTRLWVAGEGDEAASLRAMVASLSAPVDFIGGVGGAVRDRLICGADVVVVPSLEVAGGRTEGMPVTALEAMAAGVPVVASRVGGLAELPLVHVEPGKPEALAEAVRRLLDDPAEREEQVARQRQAIAAFDWEQVGPKLRPPHVSAWP